MITVVGCHAGGEIGNVVVGGVLPPPGATVFEQMQALQRDGDSLRKLLLHEPRGSVACHANLVVPATRPDCAPATSSWSRPSIRPCPARTRSARRPSCSRRAWSGCGARDGVRLEAPGGVVEARAACRDGRCESVEFANVPCFADRLDAQLEVDGLGTIAVDVAYGGMWYAIADARALGFAIEPTRRATSRSSASGSRSRRASSSVRPPENPAIAGVSIVQLAEPWQGVGRSRERRRRRAGAARPLRDRHRAVGAARRAPRPRADPRRRRDDPRLRDRLDIRRPDRPRGPRRRPPAIVPAIRGSAWITGVTQLFVDPDDPFPEGYLLSDTWGVSGLDTQA